ncbi:MAG TPA: hypothetical protein VGX76_25150 [Pirellulales bacterium]|jgi:hypothetical protein|nr:hypothetical protein [Pirellulales bacterium]
MDAQDQSDLRLLATLHYVLGGLTAACALPMLPFVWSSYRLYQEFEKAAATPAASSSVDIEAAGMNAVFALAFWFLLASLCLVHGSVVAYVGRLIARRRRRWLCLVFSALHAINVPFGTALSVFTWIILTRKSVKEGFG